MCYKNIFMNTATKLSYINKKELDLLLDSNQEEIERFYKILAESRGMLGLAITRYKKILFLEGNRGQVSLNQIQNAYISKNIHELKNLLSELFLQYISDSEMKLLIKKLNNGSCSIDYIYNEHKINPTRKLFSIISTV